MKHFFRSFATNVEASVVILLVTLPICLGVVIQTNTTLGQNVVPIFSGIIAACVGGIVVGYFSGSHLSVSAPTAGFSAVVATALTNMGGDANAYQLFLVSLILAGIIQIGMGWLKLGVIGDFIPNSVIKGMLAAIGIILILKQFPHLLGEDITPIGDESFLQADKKNTFSSMYYALEHPGFSAAIIGIVSLSILLVYDKLVVSKKQLPKLAPSVLLVIVVGILINEFFKIYVPSFALTDKHLITLPESPKAMLSTFHLPKLSALSNINVWLTALTIAIVASLETLLSIEAVDKIDAFKRVTPANKELKAQGIGNIISGLLGGFPITSAVVSSSANIYANGKSKMAIILYGFLLIMAVVFIPFILNKIPISALSAILIFIGYKLLDIKQVIAFFKKGLDQFIPFTVTIIAIITTNMLVGVLIGIAVGLFFMMHSNFHSAVLLVHQDNNYLFRLRKDVSFFNKPIVKKMLERIPTNTYVIIDISRADFIDKDIVEEINNFLCHAHLKKIKIDIKKSNQKETLDLINHLEELKTNGLAS